MSFDLTILATAPDSSDDEVLAQAVRRAGDVTDTIVELASLHGLVVFDPQDGTITRPHQSDRGKW